MKLHSRRLLMASCWLACLLAITAASTAIAHAQGATAADAGPRPGKYHILSYGAPGRPPLALGSFVLKTGGKYETFLPGDKSGGQGTYKYDAAKRVVVWLTGPHVNYWGGDFTIERQGKTHSISLRRGTSATNSTDSK
jgi:hypothetical protein